MAKSLAKNSIYNILYKVVSVLYPLVAVTYVSHILMAERMGMVSYAQNIVSYFVVFAALGIPTYGIREIAVRGKDIEARSKVFWELYLINGVSTIVAIILYCILIVSVDKFKYQIALYLVAGTQIFLNFFNVDWFYQGLEEYKYISIRSIVVKIIALLLLPLMIRTSDDYISYALIYCLAIAGNYLFNIVRIRKYVVRPEKKLEFNRHLKPIAILLMVSIAVEIYAMIDTTMLGVFCNDTTVGCYSNAMKLTRMVITTAAALGAVLFPRLSIIYQQNEKEKFNDLVNTGIKIMLMIAVPAAVGLFVLREDIVIVLFGDSFAEAAPILGVLAIMVPVVVCNTLMGGQVLVTTGKEKEYMIAVVTASVANVVMNAIMIPKFGATSAAVASLISEAIVLGMYIYYSKENVQLKLSLRFVLSMCIPLVLYTIVSVYFLNEISEERIIRLILNIITCIIIYFGLGMVLKNEAIVFTYNKAKKIVAKKK